MGANRIYVHFNFRGPKGKSYGIFAVAMYRDKDGKQLIGKKVIAKELWQDNAYVTAIQSYANCLEVIWQNQGGMIKNNISGVLLVSDNSVLCSWIEEPYKNKEYRRYMMKAIKPYTACSPKAFNIDIGLCEPIKYEKSYKYCKERYVSDGKDLINGGSEYNKIKVQKVKSVDEIINSLKPKLGGIQIEE